MKSTNLIARKEKMRGITNANQVAVRSNWLSSFSKAPPLKRKAADSLEDSVKISQHSNTAMVLISRTYLLEPRLEDRRSRKRRSSPFWESACTGCFSGLKVFVSPIVRHFGGAGRKSFSDFLTVSKRPTLALLPLPSALRPTNEARGFFFFLKRM